jgi:hypothetical protein
MPHAPLEDCADEDAVFTSLGWTSPCHEVLLATSVPEAASHIAGSLGVPPEIASEMAEAERASHLRARELRPAPAWREDLSTTSGHLLEQHRELDPVLAWFMANHEPESEPQRWIQALDARKGTAFVLRSLKAPPREHDPWRPALALYLVGRRAMSVESLWSVAGDALGEAGSAELLDRALAEAPTPDSEVLTPLAARALRGLLRQDLALQVEATLRRLPEAVRQRFLDGSALSPEDSTRLGLALILAGDLDSARRLRPHLASRRGNARCPPELAMAVIDWHLGANRSDDGFELVAGDLACHFSIPDELMLPISTPRYAQPFHERLGRMPGALAQSDFEAMERSLVPVSMRALDAAREAERARRERWARPLPQAREGAPLDGKLLTALVHAAAPDAARTTLRLENLQPETAGVLVPSGIELIPPGAPRSAFPTMSLTELGHSADGRHRLFRCFGVADSHLRADQGEDGRWTVKVLASWVP